MMMRLAPHATTTELRATGFEENNSNPIKVSGASTRY